MATFNIQLQGFVPAFRDAEVTLVNPATGQSVTRSPFADGSLAVADLDPGTYQLKVTHPNLSLPVFNQNVRLFPQNIPTLVPIPVPDTLFTDVTIRPVPLADLTPAQQTVTGIRDRVRPVVGKSPGEAIRAEDWNALASAVADLSSAILQLTTLVSPVGHAHPEIATAIADTQGNLRTFAESFGRSLVELRREIETESLRRNINDVLTVAGSAASEDARNQIEGRLAALSSNLQSDTTVFTQNLASAGQVLLTHVNAMAVASGEAGQAFLSNPSVVRLTQSATQYVQAGTQSTPANELLTYQRSSSAVGGAKFSYVVER
jgi:hypothetical protein